MKRKILMLIGVLGLGISIAQSQTYINSWENDLEGWTVVNNTNWTSAGFDTSVGVMAGSYSWAVTNFTGWYFWNQDGTQPDLEGPSSTALTTLLANGGSVDVNVTLNSGGFGWGIGYSLYLYQPSGAGILPISKWANWMGTVRSTALRFTIPAEVRSAMKANPGAATSLRLVTGGGGSGTMYMDGLRVAPFGQANSWEYDLEGWTVVNTNNFSSVGFSTTYGVSAGLYSWAVTNYTGNYIWDQDGTAPDLESALSTDLTTLMANASNVTVDVVVPSGSLGWGVGYSLYLNQPGGAGIVAVSKWENWMGSGATNTLTFPVSQAIRTALLNNPTLPCSLRLATGGGGSGILYFDNLRINQLPPTAANLWVRELWDGQSGESLPYNTTVTNGTSSAGFDAASPWVVNPAETLNCRLMAFRNFSSEPLVGQNTIALPGSLDGSYGCMVQENSGVSFFPNTNQASFWTAGDFMTRQLTAENFINFQAEGEYWFSMTLANDISSDNAQWVTFPASGWGGLGFADGSTTNAHFVAIGVSGLNVWLGPTNSSLLHGDTNVSKALYISQGTLGQPGDSNTTIYNPTIDSNSVPLDVPPYALPYYEQYSQTNFSGGPYHINAYGAQTVGHVSDANNHKITILGHLVTHSNGTATIDAKYYGVQVGGNSWNYELDKTTNSITWDCSYSFSYGGTMTKMLLFQNGQFPFYVYGFRASKNFQDVVGLDPGRIAVAPLANTYVGYAINMTNLAVEANPYSWGTPPSGYGTLTNEWYQNGVLLEGVTSSYLNIPVASFTNAGTYTSVAYDPSGTWAPVTNSAVITVTQLNPPTMTGVQLLHNGSTFQVSFDEPNLTGVDDTNHYVFSGGVVATNVTVVNSSTATRVQITTTPLPLGTKITLAISGITNVVGGTLAPTNLTFWTDLVRTGAANWDAWLCPAALNSAYFNTFLPANPIPLVGQSMARTSWDGPFTGVTMVGLDGYVGDDFGDKLYGWFIPPVTADYVFFISADDGARLSLSTNSSSTNLFVIACESDWSGNDQWTNICNQFGQSGSGPHRGDGNATNWVGANANYVWDNSWVAQSPATACLQNRSDQFIVAYYDSTGLPGGPAGATNSWAAAESKVEFCVLGTNFWPNVDANGQALIHLEAGQMYYMQLEHVQNGGGYGEGVTYKIAGTPDPLSPSASIMTGSNIAGTVPFTPTVSIVETPSGPLITYTGVLLAGTNLFGITNVLAESSASTAISLGGPSQFSPPYTSPEMFYRTSR